MKAKDWLELTKPDRAIVLDQVVERQHKSKRPVTVLDWNLRLQEVLERTALYDMGLMEEEQNTAYQQRLVMNRMVLEAEKERA